MKELTLNELRKSYLKNASDAYFKKAGIKARIMLKLAMLNNLKHSDAFLLGYLIDADKLSNKLRDNNIYFALKEIGYDYTDILLNKDNYYKEDKTDMLKLVQLTNLIVDGEKEENTDTLIKNVNKKLDSLKSNQLAYNNYNSILKTIRIN